MSSTGTYIDPVIASLYIAIAGCSLPPQLGDVYFLLDVVYPVNTQRQFDALAGVWWSRCVPCQRRFHGGVSVRLAFCPCPSIDHHCPTIGGWSVRDCPSLRHMSTRSRQARSAMTTPATVCCGL